MKKTFLEAQYRIKGRVYNHGYICIDGDFINGIFAFDCVCIQINDGHIYFYLKEYDPEDGSHYKTEQFICKYDYETLETPHTYILKSSSNEFLTLELIKKVTDPKILSDIEKEFEGIFGK